VKVLPFDARFVATLKLREDVEGVGRKDETLSFAIHSPARELLLADWWKSAGRVIRVRLVRGSDGKWMGQRLGREAGAGPQGGPNQGAGH
jgi:hypothetical protein